MEQTSRTRTTLMIIDPRIIILGNREHSKQILRALLDKDWNIVGAIGAAKQGQNEQSGYASFADICENEDINLVTTDDISDSSVKSLYRETSPDICICCGWTQIIPESILDFPTWGTVGLHLSPLPEGRGGAPVNWQIIHGNDEVTATLFQFVPEVDHGDIIGQSSVPLEQRDDISTVYPKLTMKSIDLLDEFLTDISNGNVNLDPQTYDNATYYPQRKPKDGLVDWDHSPITQWNWIRAQTKPYPGAFTFYEGRKLTVWEAVVPDNQRTVGERGEVKKIEQGTGMQVYTGDGVITLQRVQYDGLPAMWADEFGKRLGVEPGDKLGTPDDFPDWLYTGIRGPDNGYEYQTNVSTGESVTLHAVCCSHSRPRTVSITARLDEELIHEETVTVDGWSSTAIQPTIMSPGSQMMTIEFHENGTQVDVRRLYIYSGE